MADYDNIKPVKNDALDYKLKEISRTFSVKDGISYVYPLWKELLDRWFSNKKREVYIVSPFLDPERLRDVCQLMLKNQADNLALFYVRNKCHWKKCLPFVEDAVLNAPFGKVNAKFIKASVFAKIKTPQTHFHAKFIASVTGDTAEVLITTANFHCCHFENDRCDTVFYQKMSKQNFMDNMLAPIERGGFKTP